jgi:serine/threonine protein phosphatase PrpC
MDVAINGDRSSCLTQELSPGMYLFAVAHGFGRIEGEPVAPAALARLRADFERRARGNRLRRAQSRPKGVTGALVSALTLLNERIHERSASHEDYVTAGCSVTAALVLGDRAYLSHVGSTAAYLWRDGYIVSLTKTDTFDGEGIPVLTRAIGAASTLEVTVCSFALTPGDALILAGRPLSHAEIKAGGCGEQLLVVRYQEAEAPQVVSLAPRRRNHRKLFTGLLATLLFYALLCIG